MKNNILSIVVALVLCGLLLMLTDPLMLWMPPMVVMFVILAIAVVMSFWVGFVLKEKARDERELVLRMNAGRIAYLSGVTVLTVALIVQVLTVHQTDPWIAIALAVMVITKILARLYAEKNQ